MMHRDNVNEKELNVNEEEWNEQDEQAEQDEYNDSDERSYSSDASDEYISALDRMINELEDGSLDELTTAGMDITKSQFERICTALKHGKNNNLISVHIHINNYFQITDLEDDESRESYTRMILFSLASCRNIQNLDLSETAINGENSKLVANIIRNNPNLIKLTLANCQIYNRGMEVIFSVFGEEQIIKSSQIQVINLEGNKFEAKGLNYAIGKIKHIKTLKELNLANNNIEDSVVDDDNVISKLANNVIANINLVKINLSENQISHVGVKMLCDALGSYQSKNPDSQAIDLNLSANPTSHGSLEVLAKFIANNGKLHGLWIEPSDVRFIVDNDILLEFFSATNQNSYLRVLSYLNVFTTWDKKKLIKILESLKHNHTLTTLDLGFLPSSIRDSIPNSLFRSNHTLINFSPKTELNMNLQMNQLLNELLKNHVFANITARNEIFYIMKIKSLISITPNLTNAMKLLLDYTLMGIPYAHNRIKFLNVLCNLLTHYQTQPSPLYDKYLRKYHKYSDQIFARDDLESRERLGQLVVSMKKTDDLNNNHKFRHKLVSTPVIAVKCPSLKEHCMNFVALQIIHDQFHPHETLKAKLAVLPYDLVSELSFVIRLLPSIPIDENDDTNNNNSHGKNYFGLFASVDQCEQAFLIEEAEEAQAENDEDQEKSPITRQFYLANRKF